MEWALMSLLKHHLEEYVEGLDTNFDSTASPMTLRQVRIKEDKIRRDVMKDANSPFEFQGGTIGTIEFHMSWLGKLQVYATDVVMNLNINPMKAISQAVTGTRPKVIDPQHAIDLAQPRYCVPHHPVASRRKVAERWSQCTTCQIRLQTNYAELALCPICSEREMRCMLCGEFAPEPPPTVGTGTSTSQPPPLGGLSSGGRGPRSGEIYGTGGRGGPGGSSPQSSTFSWNTLPSASSLLSSYLKRPSGDGVGGRHEWNIGDKVVLKGLPPNFGKYNQERGVIAKANEAGGCCVVHLDNQQLGEVTVRPDNLLLYTDLSDPSTPSHASFYNQHGRQEPTNGWRPQAPPIQEARDDGVGVASEASLSRPMNLQPRSAGRNSQRDQRRNSQQSAPFSTPSAHVYASNSPPVRSANDPPDTVTSDIYVRTPTGAVPHHSTGMAKQNDHQQPPSNFQGRSAPHSMPSGSDAPLVHGNEKARVTPPPADHSNLPGQQPQAGFIETPRDEPPQRQQWMRDTPVSSSDNHHRGPHDAAHQGAFDHHDSRMDQHSTTIPKDDTKHDLSVGRGHQHDAVIPDDGNRQAEPYEVLNTPQMTTSESNRSENRVNWRMNSRGTDRLSVVNIQERQDAELARQLAAKEQQAQSQSGAQTRYGQDYSFTANSSGPKSPAHTQGNVKKNPYALDFHWD